VNRLTASAVTGETAVSIDYSAAGRITSKSDVGSYSYGAGGAGPFAVTSANGLSYTYDANGRMITRGSDDITWTSFDKPKKIENGTKTTEFWYGPDRARYKQELATSGTPDAVIRYVGMLFEFEDAATDTYRHFVQAGGRVVAVVERVSTTNTRKYLHRDHQGSVTKVTDSSGNQLQALAFDAWGLRRDATDWSALGSPFAGSHETERGYTGHEHLDTVELIHMNGRVQDPVLGRFISADPLVQEPFNTQSHNRYSYVWNNPSSLIDPSGFCATADSWTGCTFEELNNLPQDEAQAAEAYVNSLLNAIEAARQQDTGSFGVAEATEQQLLQAITDSQAVVFWMMNRGAFDRFDRELRFVGDTMLDAAADLDTALSQLRAIPDFLRREQVAEQRGGSPVSYVEIPFVLVMDRDRNGNRIVTTSTAWADGRTNAVYIPVSLARAQYRSGLSMVDFSLPRLIVHEVTHLGLTRGNPNEWDTVVSTNDFMGRYYGQPPRSFDGDACFRDVCRGNLTWLVQPGVLPE